MKEKIVVPKFNSKELNQFMQEKFPGKQYRKMIFIPWAEARENDCYKNVERYIEIYGGNIVYGWSVWLWPKAFVEAYHHAVWLSPKGKLKDISPDSTSHEKERIFIEDNNATFDDSMERYPKVRLALCSDPLITDFFNVCDEFDKKSMEESPGFFEKFTPSPELVSLEYQKNSLLLSLANKY